MSLAAIECALKEAEWWVAIFTGSLFVVTATLAWFTYRLWKETQRAVLDTAESRRPWLHFEIKPTDDISSDFNTNSVNASLVIINFGLSPAVNITISSLLDPLLDLTLDSERPFYVDDKRFAEAEKKLSGKDAQNFNLFSFPNQKLNETLWIGAAESESDPTFKVGIAFIFIYYQTPGNPQKHCTKRAYIILPADYSEITDQPEPARCTPCGENAE